MIRFLLTALLCLPLLAGCGTSSQKEEAAAERPAQEFFDEGNKLLGKDRYTAAAKSFDEIERQHPYSDLAPQAKFLAAHARYLNENYEEAIIAYDQFLQLYPSSKQAPLAMYEKALCYYEQISDVSRDQDMTRKAMETLELVRTRYPQSGEAKEATIKLDLTRDHLAGKEMEIGRWYQKQNQLQAAISRFRAVVDQFQTTSHVPEALHRLIESYTALGLTEEARRTAAVLGHNYPGSPWYQDTYHLVADPNSPPAEAQKPGFFKRAFKDIF